MLAAWSFSFYSKDCTFFYHNLIAFLAVFGCLYTAVICTQTGASVSYWRPTFAEINVPPWDNHFQKIYYMHRYFEFQDWTRHMGLKLDTPAEGSPRVSSVPHCRRACRLDGKIKKLSIATGRFFAKLAPQACWASVQPVDNAWLSRSQSCREVKNLKSFALLWVWVSYVWNFRQTQNNSLFPKLLMFSHSSGLWPQALKCARREFECL